MPTLGTWRASKYPAAVPPLHHFSSPPLISASYVGSALKAYLAKERQKHLLYRLCGWLVCVGVAVPRI